MIEYIIKATPYFKKEYNNNIFNYHRNGFKQFSFLILGIITLLISTLINGSILKEVVSIGGWVLIWEMVESEIFDDMSNKTQRRILEKLLNSEIVENRM